MESLDDILPDELGRARVLAGDQTAVDHAEGTPGRASLVHAAQLLQLGLEEEGHLVGETHHALLLVAEAGHLLALHQRRLGGLRQGRA